MLTYFPGGKNLEDGLPIAKGFYEDVKLEKFDINKGSVMFSSSFIDSFRRR
jgi:hypothetical protein